MPWFVWVTLLMMLSALIVEILLSLILHQSIGRRIQKKQAQISAIEAELAALEALTAEDKAWLARSSVMDDTSYAPPAIDSLWEWTSSTDAGLEVVRVLGTDANTVHITGAAGDRWVTASEFASNAVPAHLGRHR